MPAGRDRAGAGGIRFVFDDLFRCFDPGNLRFRRRQRHPRARRDQVELAWKQHRKATGMANAAGDAAGVIAGCVYRKPGPY